MNEKKTSEELTIDIKIEGVLRTIQEKILKFYIDEVTSKIDTTSLLAEVPALKNTHKQLTTILEICSKESKDIENQLKLEVDPDTKILYSKALTYIEIMIRDLEKYISNLEKAINLIEKRLTNEDALKEGIGNIINNLKLTYNEFINADKDLIRILGDIIKKNKLT